MGTIHAATLKSPRIKRFLSVLRDGKEHSTMQIIEGANVCAVSAIASEVRQRKIGINCTRRKGVYYYKLGKYKV